MADLLTSGLILPALILAVIGWLVPKLLSLVWPEGVRPLLLLALTSAVVLFGLSALAFFGLYVLDGVPPAVLFDDGIGPGLWHFVKLGGLSALFWGPIMILSVASLPRHWVKETW